MQHLSKDGLICNFRADSFQGRAVSFHKLQNKFLISVLGLGKRSGVDVSMGKAGYQPLRISRSLAMAEFSVKSFALIMW